MRKIVHDFLKWLPVAAATGAVSVAGVWNGARDWIEDKVSWAWGVMSDPWIAVFVVLTAASYIAAIIYTGSQRDSVLAAPRPVLLPLPSSPRSNVAEAIWDAKQQSNREHIRDGLARRRDLIDALRRGVIRNAQSGDKRKHIQTYLNGNTQFHAIRKHLSPRFLDELDGSSSTFWALREPADLNQLERAFLGQLDRLESEWGLDPRPEPEPVPEIALTLSSLGAYVRGNPRVRTLTQKIAKTLDRQVEPLPDGRVSEGDLGLAHALGIKTVAQLDAALLREEKLILRIAPYYVPDCIFVDQCLGDLFWVLGGRMGAEAFWNVLKDQPLVSSSKQFCQELERNYALITSY